MTHPNFQTNGASLEDCHTNFFALTELSGIKWRKLVWCEGSSGGPPGPHGSSEPLDDPVLRSYARCLAADILCVWRRVSTPRQTDVFELGPPPPSQPPPLNLSASKELWIFWYGEEPDLNELVAPELNVSDGEQGSWESGLSYKCRSLLFKALHNLIERCLLSRDFIRLGKWFVQPYTGPRKPPQTTPGANGGTLDEEAAAAMPTANASNHLSFSFAFFVHGESTVCASVDVRQHPPVRRLTRTHIHQAQASNGTKVILAPFGLCGTLMGPSFKSADSSARLLDEWGQFYPVDRSQGLSESSVVEVMVGGVKMRYPSCYVLVTDIDDTPQTTPETPPPHVPTPTPGTASSPNKNGTNTPVLVPTPPPSPVPINSKVPQPGPYQVSTEHMNAMCREATAASVLTERTWQECVLGGPPGANSSSGASNEFNGNWDLLDPTKRVSCSCSKCSTPFNQQEGPLSYPRTQESMAVPSVGSPPSVAPSPLPNPHSQQPASVPPGEPVMPTLSPHPPNPSPFTKSYTPPEQPAKTPAGGPSEANSPQVPPPSVPEVKVEVAGQGNSQQSGSGLLKRPLLTSKDYEAELGEEEQSLEMLYDYSTMNAWLNHPVKRYKPNSKENLRNSNKNDIYSMYIHNGMSNVNYDLANNVNIKTQPFVKQELNPDQRCMGEGDPSMGVGIPHGVKRPGDPYEFDEEGGGSSCNMDGFKRGPGSNIKEEPKDAKKTTGNLFTSEGLQPSYKDLDQIFDNSDDTSSDEAMQIQTPPGSTFSGSHEDSKRFSGGHSSTGSGGCPTIGILRPEELSKMFPTPPSLEHNPMPSPCGLIETQTPDFTDLTQGIVRIKQEIYPNMGSPPEEHIEDWSFVFKPPVMCKIVGSSKYAPLTNLPSQGLPVMQLPPHCVYKPSWMQLAEKQAQQQQAQTQTPAPQTTTTVQQQQNHQANTIPIANPLTPVATPNPTVVPGGPTTPHHQPSGINPFSPAGFRPPPPPYELPSPATSNASSYLNKNLNSVEAVQTPSVQRAPEASALLLNILLTDTAFNIFRDHNFESCTLCVCNGTGNIRGSDAAVYLMNGDGHPHHGSYPGSHHLNNGLHNPDSPYPGAMMGQPPPYGMMSPSHHGQSHSIDDSLRCSCGFSAVVNRRLAYGSGLFYEDEKEITGISREAGSMIRVVPGIADDPVERKKTPLSSFLVSINSLKTDATVDRDQIDSLPHSLLELIRDQCGVIPNNVNALCRAADFIKSQRGIFSNTVNVLEFTDSNEVTTVALDQSKQASADALGSCKMEDAGQRHNNQRMNKLTVHKWPFLRACGPQCNQDIVRVMKSLRPLLQDAIQKKCQTRLWEAPSAVKGPLTWRQFHRLAGRGTDDRCEPQPIPSLVVGHEKDWLSLSPYALHHWETLLLEPYSYSRDVAYIVVAPDNDSILPRVRWFFKELSTAYEMCKLGRHSPITKVLRDGILRVGKTAKAKIGNESVEEWFTMLGESETTDMLKLYAQVCKHHLAPHLQQVTMDKTLLDPPPETTDKPAPSPMPPPSTPDASSQHSSTPDKAPSTPKSPADTDNTKDSSSNTTASSLDLSHDEEEREVPCVVIYLVEPFSMGSDQPELQRLACLALLRCFQSVLSAVPDNIRSNINVQIISLESIVELGRARDRTKHSDHMRALSLNIFSQCRRLLIHTNNVKSLTGFGTAAQADVFLKSKDEKNRAPYRMYTPPYILAPMREKVEAVESFGKGTGDQASVLYLSYCLSEDQSWLLAVATDERGEILENITINIDIPNRSRRKKASARRIGLEKLMNFIIGVLSQSARPWRLVVGRLGRIGHGELKGWSWLLSKKNLLKASQHLKELCTQCALMYPSSVPCILSACLVSLEPDTTLRLMPDEFTPDERFSQVSVNSQLSTPQDVSCTHILVFPTSATTQSSQTAFQEQHITPELGDEEIFIALNDDMPECIDGMNDFSDIFNWTDSGAGGGQSPNGSPRREESGPGSPGGCGNNMGRQGSPYQSGNNKMGDSDQTEEVGTLLQQPLALGYLVSTAPTGKMPKWFWSQCPHLEGVCPAFLKNALHLHSPNVQQSSDDLFQQSAVTSHPLDSTYTTDVLRYVLEGYNALSWLALDSNTKDRLSCLPVHMQVLVQLYHTTAALI